MIMPFENETIKKKQSSHSKVSLEAKSLRWRKIFLTTGYKVGSGRYLYLHVD